MFPFFLFAFIPKCYERALTGINLCLTRIGTPNLDGFASAVFVVEAGANKLSRPVAGGSVAAGVLRPVPAL